MSFPATKQLQLVRNKAVGFAMPRYHFHIRDRAPHSDTQGSELPDIAAARSWGARLAGNLLRDSGDTLWESGDWTVEISDASNLTLYSITIVPMRSPAARDLI